MGEIAASAADVAVVTSDNPRSEDPAAIVEEIVAGVPRGRRGRANSTGAPRSATRSRRRAAGDVVLVAGKGHEPGQIVGDRVEPFDDRTVRREAIGQAQTEGPDRR